MFARWLVERMHFQLFQVHKMKVKTKKEKKRKKEKIKD
jgi:hypothetical protein